MVISGTRDLLPTHREVADHQPHIKRWWTSEWLLCAISQTSEIHAQGLTRITDAKRNYCSCCVEKTFNGQRIQSANHAGSFPQRQQTSVRQKYYHICLFLTLPYHDLILLTSGGSFAYNVRNFLYTVFYDSLSLPSKGRGVKEGRVSYARL